MTDKSVRRSWFRQLLAAKGIHYVVTRFGWRGLRSLAFDGKYQRGDWNFGTSSKGELAEVIDRYLQSGDLLIMGCGGAAILDGLEAKGLKSAVGVDLSTEAIRLAGRYASSRVRFEVNDMESYRCDRKYDVILFSESFYYVPATGQLPLLKRLGESLKGNGVFVITLAEARRYEDALTRIRGHFRVQEDRAFKGSARHLIVFR